MDIINHLFGIGETGQVKIVATPSIFRPVAPVLHNVVDGEVATTELLHGTYNLILRLIALAALPVAHGPFRHYLRLSGEGTVTANNLIHRISGNEVVVLLFLHLAPPGHFILLLIGYRTQRTQAAIRNGAIWNPLNLQRHPFASLKRHFKLVAVGVPSRTPTFRYYQFIVNIYFGITCIVENKTVITRFLGLNLAFISHRRAIEGEAIGQINHFTEMSLAVEMLEVDGIFTANNGFLALVGRAIGSCNGSLTALFIIKAEEFTQLTVGACIAEAAE